jgi:hypothetical protein
MSSRTFRILAVLASIALLIGVLPAGASGGTSTTGNPLSGAPSKIEGGNAVLVVHTTDVTQSVFQALSDLGVGYDSINSSDWTTIDYTPYTTVIAAMDGGLVEQASVQAIATGVLGAGKKLIFLGGTCYQPFALGVNQYLVRNQTANYCWTISSAPHLQVNPGAPAALTGGLPPSYTYGNTSAAYYQIRPTLPQAGLVKAARNGDGVLNYMARAISGSKFIWFTSSVYTSYWTIPADFDILKTIIDNALSV